MDTQGLFIASLRKILRPLIKVMIRYGATLPVVLPVLKQLYVEVAEDYALDNKALTDSRVSLLTGVHRKDVKQLRHLGTQCVDNPRSVSMGSKVMAEWTGNRRYQDDQGEPRVLPLMGALSFTSLVESINNDFRARTLQDEWLSNGTLTLVDDHCVKLNPKAFQPAADEQDMMNYFAANLSDHIQAAGHNLANEDKRWLERAACYQGLSQEAVQTLELYAKQQAMDALVAVNKKAYELAAAEQQQGIQGEYRYRFGTYFYHSDEHDGLPSLDAQQTREQS